MLNLERQKQNFKNHIAIFTDYGNIKILDFKKTDSCEYRIRFLFEEDYCRLHISGDLGHLIATNYNNMTFDKFNDFANNTEYFMEKVDCHDRAIWCYDNGLAEKQLTKYFDENYILDDDAYEREYKIKEILECLDDEKGLSDRGYTILGELIEDSYDCYVFGSDLGKEKTGIIDLYLLAFRLAMQYLKEQGNE